MSKIILDLPKLKAIANAIRSKDGTTGTMKISEIPGRIADIPQSMGAGLTAFDFAGISAIPFQHLGSIEAPAGLTDMAFARIPIVPVVHVASDIIMPYAISEVSHVRS